MFGDENRAKPNPRKASEPTTSQTFVPWSINDRKTRPTVDIAIPAEEMIRGSMTSDSLPATGEKAAMTIGWETSMIPTFTTENSFT